MVIAADFDRAGPLLYTWQAYDNASKADLSSTGILLKAGLFLIDPIQLEEAALADLITAGPIAGIVVTNANHLRCVETYTRRFPVPVFAHGGVAADLAAGAITEVADGAKVGDELEVIALEGAGRGEIALHSPCDGGSLIVGDALIHFDPHGFVPLPDKYCEDPKQMRRSLKRLVHYGIQRIFFAHGRPIVSNAHARLCTLLEVDLENV